MERVTKALMPRGSRRESGEGGGCAPDRIKGLIWTYLETGIHTSLLDTLGKEYPDIPRAYYASLRVRDMLDFICQDLTEQGLAAANEELRDCYRIAVKNVMSYCSSLLQLESDTKHSRQELKRLYTNVVRGSGFLWQLVSREGPGAVMSRLPYSPACYFHAKPLASACKQELRRMEKQSGDDRGR